MRPPQYGMELKDLVVQGYHGAMRAPGTTLSPHRFLFSCLSAFEQRQPTCNCGLLTLPLEISKFPEELQRLGQMAPVRLHTSAVIVRLWSLL